MPSSLVVLIAAHGRPDLLRRTLTTLAACRKPECYAGAWIVENGRRSGLEEIVASFPRDHGFRYLYVEEGNKSLALNVALGRMQNPLVFFTDDDVRLHENVLLAYAEAARGIERGEIYGGPVGVDYEIEPPRWLRRFFQRSETGWQWAVDQKTPFPKPYLLGCNWAAFAEDLRAMGGFDPTFGPGSPTGRTGQETTAQRRLRARGATSWYVPGAWVWHYVPREALTPEATLRRMHRTGLEAGRSKAPGWRGRAILPPVLARWGLAHLLATASRAIPHEPTRYAARFYAVKWSAILEGLTSTKTKKGSGPFFRDEKKIPDPFLFSVLFVSHSAGLYGAERCLLELVTGLVQRGVRATVAVPSDGPLVDVLRQQGIEVLVTGHRFWFGPRGWHLLDAVPRSRGNRRSLRQWLEPLKQRGFDLVYTNSLASPFGAMVAELLGVPHLWHVHEFIEEDFGGRFDWGRAASLRYVAHTSRAVICNSQAVRRVVERFVPSEKIVTVYNGTVLAGDTRPLPRTGRPNSGPARLYLVGSLSPHKGHLDAVRALHVLADRGIEAQLHLVGTGRHPWHAPHVRLVARRLGVSERVFWDGFVPDARNEIFPQADLALMCSRSEAFGRTAVEAASVGCPVIGTRAGGLPEVVEEGETGLLYAPGDHEALADCIQTLLNDVALYQKCSAGGIARAFERFTLDHFVNGCEAVIRETTKKASTCARKGQAHFSAIKKCSACNAKQTEK